MDLIFLISAAIGTTLFVLRMIAMFFGGAFFSDDTSEAFDAYDSEHHTGMSFKFLTLHSIAGFLMMFGWAGLAGMSQFGLSYVYAFLVALACGVAMVLLTALIMQGASYFEGPGVVFSTKKVVGLRGIVYQTIPANGQGKIQVVVDDVTRELLAQSRDKKVLESFTVIKVVSVIDHEIVEVIQLEEDQL